MKTKTKKYHYNPLNSASGTIRLLKVLLKPGGVTHASLEEVLLDDVSEQYDAISYVWGNPAPHRHIVVDGKKLRVRDNIFQCLKHLRQHRMVSKPLWIDCICINQADTAEKEQQIAQMSRIYSSASTVYVWLGRTSRMFEPERIPGHAALRSILHDTARSELLEAIIHRQDPIALVATDQLMRLVYDEYWHRLWIIQEIALASDARVVMGNMLIGAEILPAVYFTIRDASKPAYYTWLRRQNDASFEDRGTGVLDAHPLLYMLNQSGKVHDPGLAELIKAYKTKLCTDPRDRIYGLLGLTSSRHCPRIDYRCSVEELLLRTIECLIAEVEGPSSQDTDDDVSERLGVDSWTVACVMQSLGVTAEGVQNAIMMSSALAHDYTRRFELMLQAHQVILPCVCAPKDQMMLEEQCTSIQTPSGQVEHFWKCWFWFGHNIETSFRVNETGVPLLICSIGFYPAFLLSINDRNGQVWAERSLCYDLSRSVHQPVEYKSRHVPLKLGQALSTRLNTLKTDWRDVFGGKFFEGRVPLSTLELVEMGEVWELHATRYNPRDRDLDWRMTYTMRG